MNSTIPIQEDLKANTEALYALISMVSVLFIERLFSLLMKIKKIKSACCTVETIDEKTDSINNHPEHKL